MSNGKKNTGHEMKEKLVKSIKSKNIEVVNFDLKTKLHFELTQQN